MPLHLVAAGANCPDSKRLRATLTGLLKVGPLPPALPERLDRGYAGAPVHTLLTELG